jgi:DNA-binding response OmpR family regulator
MLTNIQKILVVDDEVELAKAIKLHLSRTGFTINSENNIQAARKKIDSSAKKNSPFDLVITDISMPGGSGIELLQWIQQSYPAISILLISGFGEDDLIARNTRPLLDDFCKKPFNPKTLLTKILSIEQGRKATYTTKKMSQGPAS